MKKVLFVLVLMMSVVAVNAQAAKTTPATAKPTKTTVNVADLPKSVTDNIAKDYAGFTIKEAETVTSNNVVTTQVVVIKGTVKETLVYDNTGKFVKKIPAATAAKHKAPKNK
jgi:hypothetical protein